MQETTNYNLKKPELTDAPPDITETNPNWDMVDTQLKTAADHRADSDIHFTAAERLKLLGVDEGANNYVHPLNHTAEMITQSSSYRFVSDTEKTVWNSKAADGHDHDSDYKKRFVTVATVSESIWLTLSDVGKMFCFENTTDITVSVPNSTLDNFPVGTEIELCRLNTGKVTVNTSAGVVVKSSNNYRVIAPQNGYGKLYKIATDTWFLFGDLASS